MNTPPSTTTGTAKLLKLPCNHQVQDLDSPTVSITTSQESSSEYPQHPCPILTSCPWLGVKSDILTHSQALHPDKILENPSDLFVNITKSNEKTYVITAFDDVFLLRSKVCAESGRVVHSMKGVEEKEDVTYYFSLGVRRGEEKLLSKEGVVEKSLLSVGVDCIMEVLGGVDGVVFTVTLKKKIGNTEKPKRSLTPLVNLPPPKKPKTDESTSIATQTPCINQPEGCTYTDINIKRIKHETYFCKKRIECHICKKTFSRGWLFYHYNIAHREVKRDPDTTWKVKLEDGFRFCILSNRGSTAICGYSLSESKFRLYLFTDISSEQLNDYRCGVRVTDPVTGHAKTFMPELLLDKKYDWCVVIDKKDFQSWNSLFHVSVYYNKIVK